MKIPTPSFNKGLIYDLDVPFVATISQATSILACLCFLEKTVNRGIGVDFFSQDRPAY